MIEKPVLALLIVNVDEEHDEDLDHDERQFFLVTDQRAPVQPSYCLTVIISIVEFYKVCVPWEREAPVVLIETFAVLVLEDDRIFHWVQLLVNVGQNDE